LLTASLAWEAEIEKRAAEAAQKKKAELEAKGKAPVVLKSLIIIDVVSVTPQCTTFCFADLL
jgi:hypothetical protein